METLRSLEYPKNQDNSRRFENVQEELFDYQLQYIEKMKNGEIAKPDINSDDSGDNFNDWRNKIKNKLNNSFSKDIFDYSSVFSLLGQEYHKRVKESPQNQNEIFEDWAIRIINILGNLYSNKDLNWKSKVFELMKIELNKLGPLIENMEQSTQQIGLINFNIYNDKKLEKFGINQNSPCLDIHLESLYEQKLKNNNIKNIFSGESLSLLASSILNEYPYVEAVTGKSWLIGSPIGKRVGFVKYDENKNLRNGSFWGQFINEKGQINKDKIQKFLNTGIPEYYVTSGIIKVEDYLKKFLPKERKGWVKLKRKTEDSLRFSLEKDSIIKKINRDFLYLSFDEIEEILKNSVFSDFFKTNEGLEFLGFIKEAKEKNLDSIDSLKNFRISELKNSFRNFCKEKEEKYKDIEIFIE